MRRMSGSDAIMLGLETPSAYMHTFKIGILDPSEQPGGWSFDLYRDQVKKRLHRVPAFRWKYVRAPFGLGHPFWIEDPDFNLEYHIRRVACPAPGDQRALCEFMSSVYAYQLDRTRPLWMTWVVEGLQDGKVALVTLVHHAYMDGVAASFNMKQFFNEKPGEHPPEPEQPWYPDRYPSWGKRLIWGLRDLPGIWKSNLPAAIKGLRKKRKLDKSYRKAGRPPHPDANMMPLTPINRILSPGRTFVCDSIPMADFKKAKTAFGVTINDVYMHCCAGALRKLLFDKGYDPDLGPLVAGVAISKRRPDHMAGIGNYATVDYSWLHTEIGDPTERLKASRRSANEMKEHIIAAEGADINSLVQLAPPWLIRLLRWRIRSKLGRFGLFGNVVLSNVPGPSDPLYFDHVKISNWFSTGQVFDGSAMNMTMWSYAGNANLCILADREVLPDGWLLFEYFREELSKLVEFAERQAEERPATADGESSAPGSVVEPAQLRAAASQ